MGINGEYNEIRTNCEWVRKMSKHTHTHTHLKTDGRPRCDFLLGRGGPCSLVSGVHAVVGPAAIIGQGPRPPVEHEPSLQPLASTASRVLAASTRQLFQVASARRAVDPEVPVDAAVVVVQLVSRRLDVRAQVERHPVLGRAVTVVPDRQISSQWPLRR